MATWIDALKVWNKTQPSWEIPRKGTQKYTEVKQIYDEMKSREDSKKGSGMRVYGGATLGETAAAAIVDVVNNPTKTLKTAYKKWKKGKKAIEEA